MTCIVGIEHEGGVTIGVDSASSDGLTLTIRDDSKLFRVGDYLFGFTSSWRFGQLLRYQLEVAQPDTWDVDRWMATTFVDAVRATLKAGGFARTSEGVEAGGTFLVGVAGRLYSVYDDYQVAHSTEGYDAVGSGGRVALGSLYASAEFVELTAHGRCSRALHAAAAHTTSVAGPFRIETASDPEDPR